MFKIQCLLAIAALNVGLARSWDIAVNTRNQIEFYTNNTKTYTESTVPFRDLSALVHDAVHNMLLYADKQNDNASILSYYIPTKKYQPVVRKTSDANIHGLAVDPVKRILFWTSEGSIYTISLQPDARHDDYGKLFLSTNDIPRAIAVDSCRGYVYWTNTNISRPTIERARYDGTGREVIVDTDMYMPVSIVVDQRTKKIYWADDREGIHYSIESADLDGGNRKKLYVDINHQPNDLTISKDSIYWVDLDYKAVWKFPKNPSPDDRPIKYIEFYKELPLHIEYNYAIKDQIEGQPECEAIARLSPNTSIPNTSFKIPTNAGLFCVHGQSDGRSTTCKCSPGYTGERCDTSLCHNYCLNGDCSLTADGEPQCSCAPGYSGSRCILHACQGYCLNQGTCHMKDETPVCHCMFDYEGSRCETLKVITTTTETSATTSANSTTAPICNCSSTENETTKQVLPQGSIENETIKKAQAQDIHVRTSSQSLPGDLDRVYEENGCDGWDSVRDPLIMALGILVGVLCLVCVVLITKILQLKRRPRIKKRIIVNKNVTPMTARPDQCEITIENCCNMNICETPCFEPRSTIRPTLLDSKPGKEEKKNLIANMEFPDDPY